MKRANEIAESWIATDPESVREDIRRLGIDAAAEYQTELIAERIMDGDTRWHGIIAIAMREVLEQVEGPRKTGRVRITNSFHGSATTVRANPGDSVSHRTVLRVRRALCGAQGCTCGDLCGARESAHTIILRRYGLTQDDNEYLVA